MGKRHFVQPMLQRADTSIEESDILSFFGFLPDRLLVEMRIRIETRISESLTENRQTDTGGNLTSHITTTSIRPCKNGAVASGCLFDFRHRLLIDFHIQFGFVLTINCDVIRTASTLSSVLNEWATRGFVPNKPNSGANLGINYHLSKKNRLFFQITDNYCCLYTIR